MKNWKILKTETDYRNALTRLEEVIDATIGTSEGDELELLALLIKDYEEKHYPAKLPDPVSMIKLRMEEMGLKNKDLVDIIGSESHVSSVLSRKRQITLEMARKLSKRLNIRASIFINDNISFEQYENPSLTIKKTEAA
jgi:HTH-type transcriptional regulator/antitoxin HigA